MRFRSLALAAAVAVLCLGVQPPPEGYQGAYEKLPGDPVGQPVAFSHKQHHAAKLQCADCHTTASTADQAGWPTTARCMACHRAIKADSPEVLKLAGYHQNKQKVPWARVYRVRDFVFFSHANHLKAGEDCADCHGPVETRDVLRKEVSTNMAACMQCHRARKASTDCSLCHQLGQ